MNVIQRESFYRHFIQVSRLLSLADVRESLVRVTIHDRDRW